MATRRIVVVFGMHRSGTSALTHALEPLGISLGDHLLGPSPEVNAKGFFEDIDIFLHNEEILRAHGGAWYDVQD
ncbi:MAG: sulfotransferase family protein, partial [Acidimicrobiales bacterium]